MNTANRVSKVSALFMLLMASASAAPLFDGPEISISLPSVRRLLGAEANAIVPEESPEESRTTQCIFIHGLGQKNTVGFYHTDWEGQPPSDAVTLDAVANYWGGLKNVKTKTKGICTQLGFVSLDTIDEAWYSDVTKEALLAAFSTANEQKSDQRERTIFTHSMGNLILGNVLPEIGANEIGANTRWISLAAPWRGASSAKWADEACNNANRLQHAKLKIAGKVNKLCEVNKPCPQDGGCGNAAVKSLLPEEFTGDNQERADGIIRNAKWAISGSLCGDGLKVRGSKENTGDDQVDIDSCTILDKKSRFYYKLLDKSIQLDSADFHDCNVVINGAEHAAMALRNKGGLTKAIINAKGKDIVTSYLTMLGVKPFHFCKRAEAVRRESI